MSKVEDELHYMEQRKVCVQAFVKNICLDTFSFDNMDAHLEQPKKKRRTSKGTLNVFEPFDPLQITMTLEDLNRTQQMQVQIVLWKGAHAMSDGSLPLDMEIVEYELHKMFRLELDDEDVRDVSDHFAAAKLLAQIQTKTENKPLLFVLQAFRVHEQNVEKKLLTVLLNE